ncbi:unnamed protein product [Mortierella alpina]
MHYPGTTTDNPRRLHEDRRDASDRPQDDVKPVSMDSAQEANDDIWQLSDLDQDDVDDLTHRRSVQGKASTSTSEGSRNEDMDFCSALFRYVAANQATEKEKLALKREQFEYSKKVQEYKHAFDMQKLALETRRMELEHQRMLEKQKLDAEYRLAKLKSSDKFALAELDYYPEYRNRQRGRGRQPESISWF